MQYSRKIMPLSPVITYEPPSSYIYIYIYIYIYMYIYIYIYTFNPSCHHAIILLITCQPSKTERNTKLDSTLAQPLAQPLAQEEKSRSGESSKSWNNGLCTISLRRDPPRLGEILTQINGAGRMGDPSRENYWASLSSPRLGEIARLGESIRPRPLFRRVTDQKHNQIVQ